MDHSGIMKVAEAMISVLGSSAALEARRKASEALDQGDMGAFRAWHQIFRVARTILRNRSSKP